jgi:hypothetical protein
MKEEKNFELYTPKPNENPLIESINKFYEFQYLKSYRYAFYF